MVAVNITAWRKTLSKYYHAPRYKHLTQIPHILGYLKNCECAGELLHDPYIDSWIADLKLLIKRAREEDQLALVSLHDALLEIK